MITSNIICGFFLGNIWFNTGRYRQAAGSSDKQTGSDGHAGDTRSFRIKMKSMTRLDTSHAMQDNPHAVQLTVDDFDLVGPGSKGDDASALDEKEKW